MLAGLTKFSWVAGASQAIGRPQGIDETKRDRVHRHPVARKQLLRLGHPDGGRSSTFRSISSHKVLLLVSVLLSFTSAPFTAAPEESVTVPEIPPRNVWQPKKLEQRKGRKRSSCEATPQNLHERTLIMICETKRRGEEGAEATKDYCGVCRRVP